MRFEQMEAGCTLLDAVGLGCCPAVGLYSCTQSDGGRHCGVFNFAAHRRIEHYQVITEQAGATPPE